MTVFFNGKALGRCPSGYTTCNQVAKQSGRENINCMPADACDRLIAQMGGREDENPTNEREPSQNEQDNDTEDDQEEKKADEKEKVVLIEDFIELLQKGILIDPQTGEQLGTFSTENPTELINLFKKLDNSFPSDLIKKTTLGEKLDGFLTILNSKKLDGNSAAATGLLEKFLNSELGMDIEFDTN